MKPLLSVDGEIRRISTFSRIPYNSAEVEEPPAVSTVWGLKFEMMVVGDGRCDVS